MKTEDILAVHSTTHYPISLEEYNGGTFLLTKKNKRSGV